MRYWTTDGHPTHEQLSYWRDAVCQAFTPLAVGDVAIRPGSSTDRGQLSSWVRSSALTSTNCAEISSQTQLITHGDAEVRRTDAHHVFVNLQLHGHSVVTQGGRTTFVQAGAFSLVDTTSPYRQQYVGDPANGEWRVLSFRVPQQELLPLIARPNSVTAVAFDARKGGLARIAASTMLSTWSELERLDRSHRAAAESAVLSIIAAVAGGSDSLRDTSREALNAALRASVNRYLTAHLHGTADLSAAAVARHFAVSVRKLHAVYEGTDASFSQTVMRLRVQGCARDLVAATRSSMTQLAAHWGFCDLSHLNRVFRAHYGCLPSEYATAAAARV